MIHCYKKKNQQPPIIDALTASFLHCNNILCGWKTVSNCAPCMQIPTNSLLLNINISMQAHCIFYPMNKTRLWRQISNTCSPTTTEGYMWGIETIFLIMQQIHIIRKVKCILIFSYWITQKSKFPSSSKNWNLWPLTYGQEAQIFHSFIH